MALLMPLFGGIDMGLNSGYGRDPCHVEPQKQPCHAEPQGGLSLTVGHEFGNRTQARSLARI